MTMNTNPFLTRSCGQRRRNITLVSKSYILYGYGLSGGVLGERRQRRVDVRRPGGLYPIGCCLIGRNNNQPDDVALLLDPSTASLSQLKRVEEGGGSAAAAPEIGDDGDGTGGGAELSPPPPLPLASLSLLAAVSATPYLAARYKLGGVGGTNGRTPVGGGGGGR